MVPEGWKLQTVGAVFDVQLGKMLNKAAKEKSPQQPYLTNFNVRWGAFDTTTLNTMHFSDRDQEKFALKDGDLIMCEGGEVGRCAIWRNAVSPCFYQKALHRLRSKGTIIPEFFQAYMTSIAGTKLLEDYTSRTSIAHLTREKLLELPVKVPPLPEQKKIAQILSTWDQAIAATERLLENSQQRKKGLMQQLLTGKKRLLGFEGEWEEVPLSKLADYVKGYTYKSDEYSDAPTDTGFLTLKSLLRGGGYSKEGLKYLKTEIDDKFLVQEGEIVFAVTDITRGAEIVGAPLLVPDLGLPQVAISMDMVKLVVKPGVAPKFIYFALKRSAARNFMRSRASGSTVLHLDVKGSKKLRLPIPKDACEQEAISEVLTIADQEVEALSQRLVWLKHEKKALTQQLLTGKRRVQVDTEAA